MKNWKIPVAVEVWSTVSIEAETPEDAKRKLLSYYAVKTAYESIPSKSQVDDCYLRIDPNNETTEDKK